MTSTPEGVKKKELERGRTFSLLQNNRKEQKLMILKLNYENGKSEKILWRREVQHGQDEL